MRTQERHTPICVEVNEEHWYTSGKSYLPSVSTILGTLKDGLEFVSPYDLRKAQERGKKVHHATEQLEAGQTLSKDFYDDTEWQMIIGFINWHHDHKPLLIASEVPLADKKLGYGGTPDRIYQIGDKIVLLDIKTTSAIYPKHWLQVAAYCELSTKQRVVPRIDQAGILRLTAKSKSGYQYATEDVHSSDIQSFHALLKVWKHFHPDKQPTILQLPETLSL